MRHSLACALVGLILAACADPGPSRPDFEALAAKVPWEGQPGHESRTVPYYGGIVALQQRHGDDIDTVWMDESGHGAVICSWEVYRGIQEWVELCRPDEVEFQSALSSALDRINDFIVANSVDEVPKADLEAEIESRLRLIRTGRASFPADKLEAACRNNSNGYMFRQLQAAGTAKLKATVDDLLSVPRPPVMAPCL